MEGRLGGLLTYLLLLQVMPTLIFLDFLKWTKVPPASGPLHKPSPL